MRKLLIAALLLLLLAAVGFVYTPPALVGEAALPAAGLSPEEMVPLFCRLLSIPLAAPYAPFPESIRKETDVLHIQRTWIFKSGDKFAAK